MLGLLLMFPMFYSMWYGIKWEFGSKKAAKLFKAHCILQGYEIMWSQHNPLYPLTKKNGDYYIELLNVTGISTKYTWIEHDPN